MLGKRDTEKDSLRTSVQDTLEIVHLPAPRLELCLHRFPLQTVTPHRDVIEPADSTWRKQIYNWPALHEWRKGHLDYANIALR